jgi:hypothetical protein
MALPPFDAGAEKVTIAWAFPADAATPVGAPGIVPGVTAVEAADGFPVPHEFVAVTLKVYAVPLARPVTVWLVAVDPAFVSVPPGGLDITVYPVMVLPPLETGGVKLTVAIALPADAAAPVGGSGTVPGVTAVEAADGFPVPHKFVAVTVKVYAVPLVRPFTK